MRVGLVVYGSLEARSGGYLYDLRLAERLLARGHQVDHLPQRPGGYASRLALNLDPAALRPIASWEGDVLLEDELNHPSLLAVNRAVKRSPGRRPAIVALVHHLRSSERHGALALGLYRLVERGYLGGVDAFIHNSESTRASVLSLVSRRRRRGADGAEPGGDGNGGGPSIVALPGADRLDGLSSSRDGPRGAVPGREAGEPPEAPRLPSEEPRALRLLYAGSIEPRKNLLVILRALAAIPPNWSLDIAGSSPGNPAGGGAYERRCRAIASGLSGRVSFLGRVGDRELAELYRRSELLVMPSDHEGFGIVYAEAMRHGVVPIGGRGGGASEAIGEAGILVPPGDVQALAATLSRLAADPSELVRLRAASLARGASLPGWSESMDRIVDWLEALVTGSAEEMRSGGGIQ